MILLCKFYILILTVKQIHTYIHAAEDFPELLALSFAISPKLYNFQSLQIYNWWFINNKIWLKVDWTVAMFTKTQDVLWIRKMKKGAKPPQKQDLYWIDLVHF